LAFGLAITIAGSVAYSKSGQLENSAEIFKTLNVKLIAAFIVSLGIATIVTSLSGFVGAATKNTTFLKIYAVILFCVCAIQLGIGSYMVTLNVDDLRAEWFKDTDQGEARREQYQDYMDCCGFEFITDSQPETECPSNSKTSCKDATMAFMKKYLAPVAVIAVVIAVIELISLTATCIIIATSATKEDFYDNPFGY